MAANNKLRSIAICDRCGGATEHDADRLQIKVDYNVSSDNRQENTCSNLHIKVPPPKFFVVEIRRTMPQLSNVKMPEQVKLAGQTYRLKSIICQSRDAEALKYFQGD